MSENLILIVDEHDNPIGAASKEEAWREGLWHRIVHVVVEDEQGRILLQKRSKRMELQPGRWTDSASGHVDAAEAYETAARREYCEELGQTECGELTELGMRTQQSESEGRKLNRFHKYYRARVRNEDFVPNIQETEVDKVMWVTVRKLHDLADNNRDEVTASVPFIAEKYYPL